MKKNVIEKLKNAVFTEGSWKFPKQEMQTNDLSLLPNKPLSCLSINIFYFIILPIQTLILHEIMDNYNAFYSTKNEQ